MNILNEHIKNLSHSNETTNVALELLFKPATYPGLQVLSTHQIIMQIWRNDSLNDFCTWTLFRHRKSYILRKVTWKQRFEYQLNKPITYASDSLLDDSLINELESLAQRLTCTEISKNKQQLTIDGIYYGINYFDKCAVTKSVEILEASNTKKLELIINRIDRNPIIQLN